MVGKNCLLLGIRTIMLTQVLAGISLYNEILWQYIDLFGLICYQAYIEKEDSKKLKQKQREKMQPKMGKMDIDYQVIILSVSNLLFYL